MTHRARLVVENRHNSTIRLRIEPWADEYDLPPGARGSIHSFGPSQVEVLIQLEPGVVTVWENSSRNSMSDVVIDPRSS
jgi:hypothetical protein